MASRGKRKSCGSEQDRDGTPPREFKKKVQQRFKKEYSEKWPCLQPGKKGETFCFCTICVCEVSIGHGGRDDCRRHIETKKHTAFEARAKQTQSCKKISACFPTATASKSVNSTESEVIRAEVQLVDLVTELNLPFTALDKFTKAFKTMFKDSDVAKNFQCGRSKGTAIVKELAAKSSVSLADRMKKQPFTISTDGSNDAGSTKLFPLVIRTFDPHTLTVQSEVLAVPACEGSATGEKIFGLIQNELQVHQVPWGNCLAMGSDNANVMVGKDKGVYGFLLRAHPGAYLSGCVCHLVHIAAEKGASCLPLNVDQLLVDVFYYLDKSSKRQAAFKDMQLLLDIKQNKILKHVSTRWLSIRKCLPRLLDNWQALYNFFKEQENQATGSAEKDRAARLKKIFQSPTNRLYCLFLSDVLGPFDKINTELQSDKPQLHVLKHHLELLLKNLLLRFVKPSAMLYKDVLDVDFDTSYNVKKPSDLLIGQPAADFLADSKSNLREERKEEFYTHVKDFFQTSSRYIKGKLPFGDKVLEHAQVADPAKQTESSSSSLTYFLNRFPKLLPDGVTAADVQMEFAQYQCTDISQCIEDRVDATWGRINRLSDNGEAMFKVLPKIMVSILCIPHSSAHCERIFSLVRKNQTDSRSRLGHDTLEALLVAKSRPGDALQRAYTDSDYTDFKSAYYRSLNSV